VQGAAGLPVVVDHDDQWAVRVEHGVDGVIDGA
jgi:hypothetical protein